VTRQPIALHNRLASTIAGHVKTIALHTQQIVNLQSQVAAAGSLAPGAWEPITLAAGWVSVPGSIPAQARLITSTTVQVIGNIQGGTTANATVIGSLTAGFFNTVHAHTFQAVAVAGAAAVAAAGTVSGMVDNAGVNNGNLQGSSTTDGISNGNIQNFTASASGSGSHEHAAGGLSVISGTHFHTSHNFSIIDGHHQHGSTALASATPVNYNAPSVTLGTDGSLTIMNVSPTITQLSFHEASLPLFTA
jgi:hypothetical protein